MEIQTRLMSAQKLYPQPISVYAILEHTKRYPATTPKNQGTFYKVQILEGKCTSQFTEYNLNINLKSERYNGTNFFTSTFFDGTIFPFSDDSSWLKFISRFFVPWLFCTQKWAKKHTITINTLRFTSLFRNLPVTRDQPINVAGGYGTSNRHLIGINKNGLRKKGLPCQIPIFKNNFTL